HSGRCRQAGHHGGCFVPPRLRPARTARRPRVDGPHLSRSGRRPGRRAYGRHQMTAPLPISSRQREGGRLASAHALVVFSALALLVTAFLSLSIGPTGITLASL